MTIIILDSMIISGHDWETESVITTRLLFKVFGMDDLTSIFPPI